MKFSNLLKVYRRDLKSIVKNPVALLIIVGVCVLPSLYAWVNIIACWDVYENTGTIPVAVVNNDQTATFADKDINIGTDVVEQLKKNRNIQWHFVNSKTANLGLVDGTYYAVIEIPRNFSANFLSVVSNHPQKPYIIYKVDTKINPVAVKITDSAKNTLVQQIKTNFVSTVNETIFSSLNIIGNDADENKESLIKLKDAVVDLNRNMSVIQTSLDSVRINSDNLNTFLSDMNMLMPAVQNSLQVMGNSNLDKQGLIRSTQGMLNNAINNIDTNLEYAQASNERLNGMFKSLNQSSSDSVSTKVNAVLPSLHVELDALNNANTATIDYLKKLNEIDNLASVDRNITNLKKLKTDLENSKKRLETLKKDLNSYKGDADKLNTYIKTESAVVQENMVLMDQTRVAVVAQLENINQTLNDPMITKVIEQLKVSPVDGINEAVNKALTTSDKTNQEAKAKIDILNKDIDKGIEVIDKMSAKNDKALVFLGSHREDNYERKGRVKTLIESLEAIKPIIEDEQVQLGRIQQQANNANTINKQVADTLNKDNLKIRSQLNSAVKNYNSSVKSDLNVIGDNLLVATEDAAEMIQAAQDLNNQISNSILLAQDGSKLASEFSGDLNDKLTAFKALVGSLGSKFEMIDNSDLALLISILQSNPEFMGDFMSNPFELKTESVYAIPNYGSSMAPIYTTLALWVGCMILNSVMRAGVGSFEGVELLTAKERHFGKMMIFCTLAMIQGLIVAVGNIALLGIYVIDAPMFIMLSVFSSLVFCIITFTLMSTMGNVGKALSIVYMILQLVGSGGTYPIQCDPLIFRIIQPLCPFSYTVSGLREAVAGPLAIGVIKDFVGLFTFGIVFLLFGYFTIDRLNPWVVRFEKRLKESGIGE